LVESRIGSKGTVRTIRPSVPLGAFVLAEGAEEAPALKAGVVVELLAGQAEEGLIGVGWSFRFGIGHHGMVPRGPCRSDGARAHATAVERKGERAGPVFARPVIPEKGPALHQRNVASGSRNLLLAADRASVSREGKKASGGCKKDRPGA